MIVIQIGNSDNKLTQQEWSEFWHAVNNSVSNNCHEVHFSGLSDGNAPWQNACWVANPMKLNILKNELSRLCVTYNQDSIAIIEGNTQFVTAEEE